MKKLYNIIQVYEIWSLQKNVFKILVINNMKYANLQLFILNTDPIRKSKIILI